MSVFQRIRPKCGADYIYDKPDDEPITFAPQRPLFEQHIGRYLQRNR